MVSCVVTLFACVVFVRRDLWDNEASVNETIYMENGVTQHQPVSLFTMGEHYLMTAADFVARATEYNGTAGTQAD